MKKKITQTLLTASFFLVQTCYKGFNSIFSENGCIHWVVQSTSSPHHLLAVVTISISVFTPRSLMPQPEPIPVTPFCPAISTALPAPLAGPNHNLSPFLKPVASCHVLSPRNLETSLHVFLPHSSCTISSSSLSCSLSTLHYYTPLPVWLWSPLQPGLAHVLICI